MVPLRSPGSVLLAPAVAFLPTAIFLALWGGLRSLRACHNRGAAKLMAQAAERFARGETTAALQINARVLALDPRAGDLERIAALGCTTDPGATKRALDALRLDHPCSV